jgi:hypothetical protein
MSLIKEQLGEPAIRDMYDRVLMPLFVWRYEVRHRQASLGQSSKC